MNDAAISECFNIMLKSQHGIILSIHSHSLSLVIRTRLPQRLEAKEKCSS